MPIIIRVSNTLNKNQITSFGNKVIKINHCNPLKLVNFDLMPQDNITLARNFFYIL
jgi:hypothetical protein